MIIRLNTNNTSSNDRRELDGPILEWVQGLHEQKVAAMELYNQSRHSAQPMVRVTLVDGSSYRIQRTPNKNMDTGGPFTDTIEVTALSDFVSRPTIVVSFKFPLTLHIILLLCCSIPDPNDTESYRSKADNTCFGLTVMLNAVRCAFLELGRQNANPIPEPPPQEQIRPLLDELWKDVYRQILIHEHDFWEDSLLESTKSLVQDLIYEQAIQALQAKGLKEEDRPVACSTIARAVMLLSQDGHTEMPPQDVAWDKSWMEFTHSLNNKLPNSVQPFVCWLSAFIRWEPPSSQNDSTNRWLPPARNSIKMLPPTGKSARGLSSQMDARDLPHRYPLKEVLSGKSLIHFQSVGHDYSQLIADSSCFSGEFQSERPVSNSSDCHCHVWASDWQVATSIAWDVAWTSAFDAGRKAAKNVLDTYRINLPTPIRQPQAPPSAAPRYHPAINGLIRFRKQLISRTTERKEIPHSSRPNASEWRYHDLKAYSQQQAKTLLKDKRFTREDNANIEERIRTYKNNAWKHAHQTIGQQGGYSNLAQLEWQKFKNGPILNRLSDKGFIANWWKKGFEGSLKAAWLSSWDAAWLAVWQHAYHLAQSKGIELGVATELANDTTPGRHQLLGAVRTTISYNNIRDEIHADIQRQELRNALEYIRSLVKDLNHISNVYKHIAHNSHDRYFTIRVSVPNKDRDLDDMSRIRLRPPVLRELSYLELRKFVMREYFKNESRETRTLFQRNVSLSWKEYNKLYSG